MRNVALLYQTIRDQPDHVIIRGRTELLYLGLPLSPDSGAFGTPADMLKMAVDKTDDDSSLLGASVLDQATSVDELIEVFGHDDDTEDEDDDYEEIGAAGDEVDDVMAGVDDADENADISLPCGTISADTYDCRLGTTSAEASGHMAVATDGHADGTAAPSVRQWKVEAKELHELD